MLTSLPTALLPMILQMIRRYWLLISAVLLCVITFLSLQPLSIELKHNSDKMGHLLAYGSLIFPAALRKPRYFMAIFIFFIAWSGLIEILQNHVGRFGDWYDLLANTLGLSVGALLGKLCRKWLTKPLSSPFNSAKS